MVSEPRRRRPSGDEAAETEFITSTFEQDVKQVVHLLTVDAVLLLGFRRRGAEVSAATRCSFIHTKH